MVRADFELSITEGDWEGAVEVGGPFVTEEPEAEPLPVFDPTREAQRLEDWIAFNLDEAAQLDQDRPSASHDFLRNVDRLAAFKPKPVHESPNHKGPLKTRGNAPAIWPRFQSSRRRGVTVVRLVDRSLVKVDQIEEMAADLFALIDAGNDRIVLNFGGVERLGSLAAAVLAEAHRRCQATEGGSLRICLLQPQLAGIIAIPGLARAISAYPDETTAVESSWPSRLSPRPLPFEIISYIKLDITQCEMNPMDTSLKTLPEPRVDPQAGETPRVWLINETEQGTIRSVGVSKNHFLIGRERDCHLSLKSLHVSKRHATIERRGGLNFLRDLGSKNGTRLNGRILRNQAAEIHPGDRIGVGDIQFVVASDPRGGKTSAFGGMEDLITEWVRDDDPESTLLVGETPVPTIQDFSVHEESDEPRPFKYEVIEDVLVITPRIHQVSDESAVAALRSTLQELFDHPLPHRVVVSLEFVSHLSPQAIGALLAHHLRLERAGGSLRLCNASHPLMAILDRIHFTMLMECYATLDDAILMAWN